MSALVKEPIYQQLNQLLRSALASDEFRVGKQFLTEREICRRFGVSRATANKALSSLVSEGLLEFRKGLGTFVRVRPMDLNLRALVSFTAEARAAGKVPATKVLKFEQLSGERIPDEVARLLRIRGGERVYSIERLRLADGVPLILERRNVAAAWCPGLTAEDATGSLYRVWTERYHLRVERAEQTIQALNIRGADARLLMVRPGAAGLSIRAVGYLPEETPLWCEQTLYRGDAYEFRNELGGIKPSGQPMGRFLL